MTNDLKNIAQKLIDSDKKVQLIYAFNGTGKTRLSRELKELVDPKKNDTEEADSNEKVLYYNAFTEDLFYWDNDLDDDKERKLKIHPNKFTDWVLEDQGQELNIISHFQRYTNDKLTPNFNVEYTHKNRENKIIVVKPHSEVTFSIDGGNDINEKNIKISKGEENNFIWCIFYSLLEQVIEVLNPTKRTDEQDDSLNDIRTKQTIDRLANQFKDLEYVFIDDPVSSLDDSHLIELAVDIAALIKQAAKLKFIIATHNPLFYNVLYNELNNKECYMLHKHVDGTFELEAKKGDSNRSFSYHLYLKDTIEKAIKTNSIQKYHFMLLRNLYEKTANFLGYPKWSELLPHNKQLYYNRIIQFTSHSTLSNEVVPEPTEPEKTIIKYLLEHLVDSKYWKDGVNDAIQHHS